jgi:hypothetical protein
MADNLDEFEFGMQDNWWCGGCGDALMPMLCTEVVEVNDGEVALITPDMVSHYLENGLFRTTGRCVFDLPPLCFECRYNWPRSVVAPQNAYFAVPPDRHNGVCSMTMGAL